jgi:3-hydroxybutyryl-CoA dehydratase
MDIKQFSVGQSASLSKTVTEYDVYTFAGVTGDFNPAHVDEVYASGTSFKKRIAHGMLSAGLVSAVLGTKLPGPGSIYAGQTLKFLAPVYIGDTITATATVKEVIAERRRLILTTECTNQEGVAVLSGEATIFIPKD